MLVDAARAVGPIKDEGHEWERRAKPQRIVRARQAIAEPRGAVDASLHWKMVCRRGFATRLRSGNDFEGGRHEEALKSVRQQGRERLKFGDWRDLADGAGLRYAPNPIGRDWR